jgi:lipopolysaccharide transport system ATP-binding protein
VLAVGDAELRKKSLEKMGEVTEKGRTILFVSHNLAAVRLLCRTCVLLDKGRKLDMGPSHEIIDRYMSGEGFHDRSEVHFSRPGRAPIWITRATVLNDGKRSSSLPMGAEITLQINFDAAPATLYPGFGFVISASDGTRVLGANNHYQPSKKLAHRVERGSIVCRVGRVPLTRDVFDLAVAR